LAVPVTVEPGPVGELHEAMTVMALLGKKTGTFSVAE
jgi:hypothetical protein